MSQDDPAGRAMASLEESVAIGEALSGLVAEIVTAAGWIADALNAGSKVLLFGNGGSAADCQHLAAELVGRFERERRPAAAIALTTDTSALTAIANDYGVEHMFSRQVQALVRDGDVVVALSTSGGSANVLEGVAAARVAGARTIAFTGETGGELAAACDLALQVPSQRTSRIQEAHITIGHVMCELVEPSLPGN
jgi:D-sedoheptulose 7-phosphate isomerase